MRWWWFFSIALFPATAPATDVVCKAYSTYPCTQMKVFSKRRLGPPDGRCLVELKEVETQLFHRVYLTRCPDVKGAHYMAVEVECNPKKLSPPPPDTLRIYRTEQCETPPGEAKRKQVDALASAIKPGDRAQPLLQKFTKLYRVYDHEEKFEANRQGGTNEFHSETWIFHEYPGYSVYVPVAARVKHGLHRPKVSDFFVADHAMLKEEYVAKRECEDWGGTATKKGPDLYEYDCKLPLNPKLQRK